MQAAQGHGRTKRGREGSWQQGGRGAQAPQGEPWSLPLSHLAPRRRGMISVGRWWLFSTPMPQLRPRCHSIYRFLPVPAWDWAVCCLVCLRQLHPGGIRGRKAAKSTFPSGLITPGPVRDLAAPDRLRLSEFCEIFCCLASKKIKKTNCESQNEREQSFSGGFRVMKCRTRDTQPSSPAQGALQPHGGSGNVSPRREQHPGVLPGGSGPPCGTGSRFGSQEASPRNVRKGSCFL